MKWINENSPIGVESRTQHAHYQTISYIISSPLTTIIIHCNSTCTQSWHHPSPNARDNPLNLNLNPLVLPQLPTKNTFHPTTPSNPLLASQSQQSQLSNPKSGQPSPLQSSQPPDLSSNYPGISTILVPIHAWSPPMIISMLFCKSSAASAILGAWTDDSLNGDQVLLRTKYDLDVHEGRYEYLTETVEEPVVPGESVDVSAEIECS